MTGSDVARAQHARVASLNVVASHQLNGRGAFAIGAVHTPRWRTGTTAGTRHLRRRNIRNYSHIT